MDAIKARDVIIALDPPRGADSLKWCKGIIESTADIVAGYKIGLPLLLDVGLRGLKELADAMGSCELKIADFKLADIGFIMSEVLKRVSEVGYNAIIAHAFIGLAGGLGELSKTCSEMSMKLITVVSMSHPGSMELIDMHLENLIAISENARVWGVVAPATRPQIIRKIRKIVGVRLKILSPGIGPQGAAPKTALEAGADYEIVGRLITYSDNPRRKIAKIYG